MKAPYYGYLSPLIDVLHPESLLNHSQSVNAIILLYILQQALCQGVVVEPQHLCGCIGHYLHRNISICASLCLLIPV